MCLAGKPMDAHGERLEQRYKSANRLAVVPVVVSVAALAKGSGRYAEQSAAFAEAD